MLTKLYLVLLTISLLLVYFYLPFEPHLKNIQKVSADFIYVDPNADGSTGNWNSTGVNYYTEVDDAIYQPSVPVTSDRLSGVANNAGSIFLNLKSI